MSKRVLVVDDEPPILRLLEITLSRAGYQVSTAGDGLQGLQKMQDEVPDLVVLDLAMPRMDGYEMLEHVRADARLRRIPVIVITALEVELPKSPDSGVAAHLTKPLEMRELLTMVGDMTRRTGSCAGNASLSASAM